MSSPNLFLQSVRGLLAYTMWADRAILESVFAMSDEDRVRETGGSFGSVLGTMAHVLGAQQIWLSRFLGSPLERLPDLTDYPTLPELAAAFQDHWPQLEFYLASLSGETLAGDFTWTNTRGETNTAPMRQVLLHFVNHTTYHRGQIVNLMRQLGYEPPATDLVYYRGAM